jgi:hypothetical protein
MRQLLSWAFGASVIGLTLWSASGAKAAPLFEAAPGGGPYEHGPNPVSSTGGGAKQVFNNNGLLTTQTFAASSPAGLRASSRATLSATDANGTASMSGGPPEGGYAAFTFDDFVVRGPVGSPALTTNIHFRLDGTFATDEVSFGQATTRDLGVSASLDVIGQVIYAGPTGLVTEEFDGSISQTNENGSVTRRTSGVLSEGGPDFASGVITVPVNQPFKFYLEMDPSAGVNATVTPAPIDDTHTDKVSVQLDGLSDFSHTLTFATGQPVFDLPPGYTADSQQAGIANNSFTPEPSASAALAGATAMLALRRRRARRPS